MLMTYGILVYIFAIIEKSTTVSRRSLFRAMVQWDCIDSFRTQEKRIVITEFTYTVSVAVIASVRGIWDNAHADPA